MSLPSCELNNNFNEVAGCLNARLNPFITREIPFIVTLLLAVCHGIQQFEETPQYTEVNPGQDAKLVCRVLGKRGQCIWQKDQKVCY
ncbi:hypothetical protein ALC53_02742 [Atta colombica]|uniref:Ig-like domain-containing protein n=1 Tax=Atta colombica TaxID=520822 RepID=A0A195BP21_9HYME|nr:hypothetical protein ALC53_02742 [Atta colombica]